MFHKNYFFRKPGQSCKSSAALHTDPHQLQKLMVKVNRLNSDNTVLQQRLQEKEEKIRTYLTLLLQYEQVLREEIALYKLQHTKIKTIEDAYHSYEIFIKDIDKQIELFLESFNSAPNIINQISPIKRILIRFIHQKVFNESAAEHRLTELQDLIAEKQKLISSFQSDVKHLKNKNDTTIQDSKSQLVNLN